MASQQKSYSPEFKAEVSLEALARSKKNLEPLSEKYKVPVSLILTWAVQLERNAAHIYTTTATPTDIKEEATRGNLVDVEISDSDISESIEYGAMHDNLDYKKLIFWAVLGIFFFAIFVQLLIEMYQSNTQVANERAASHNEYYQSNVQKNDAQKRLSTFGVVDLNKGVYRMPIDSVINEMAVDGDRAGSTHNP